MVIKAKLNECPGQPLVYR